MGRLRWLGLLLLFLASPLRAQTVTDLVLPGYVGTSCQGPGSPANTLVCARVPAWAGITGATSIAGEIVTGLAGQTCGFAIYPDADSGAPGTVLASVSGACAAAGAISATGLGAFNIVAGTMYRICFCTTTTTSGANSTCNGAGVSFLTGNDTGTGTGHFADLYNTFLTTGFATAATACSSGAPPSTTGVLTATTTVKGPPILVFH